ncbi:hypothetical protein H6A30_07180 [Bacteroides caecigallinarum]|uniref:hypothetical protein n=1 Tax=Bacteroides caecigallinarum TaxID=1411144 RepID=UPI0019587F88|nr:hypothetical protein [Bacteroides caecigallinarum]MBM6890057.1 hypothetical protein [Bacteroides caecigallinarum]
MKDSGKSIEEISKLSARELALIRKRYALHCKYEEAVNLYANTNSTIRNIAKQCMVSEDGLKAYLHKHWRELMLYRHGINADGKDPKEISYYMPDGISCKAYEKYKDAVQACKSINYIELNISQIARKFGHNATSLANFMQIHYSDLLTRRKKIREKMGFRNYYNQAVHQNCVKQYEAAVEMYRNTNLSVKGVAEQCNVSDSGLSQHIRFYHKDLMKEKKEARQKAKVSGKKKHGELLGNGRKNEPLPATVEKYAEALALYRDTALTAKEIALRTGVNAESFRFYLHRWYRALVLERSGIVADEDAEVNMVRERQRMKTVAAKYAPAIESLQQNPRPASQVAVEFGHNTEVFRNYIRKHEPELAKSLGLKPLPEKKNP